MPHLRGYMEVLETDCVTKICRKSNFQKMENVMLVQEDMIAQCVAFSRAARLKLPEYQGEIEPYIDWNATHEKYGTSRRAGKALRAGRAQLRKALILGGAG